VLNTTAKALGFAASTRRHRRLVIEPDNPALDPARRADAGDLQDARMRQGRTNGGGSFGLA
jgi:hypothetical protein